MRHWRFHFALLVLVLGAGSLLAQQDAPVDLSGQWCSVGTITKGPGAHRATKSEITITMVGTKIDVHSSNGAVWSGTFDPQTRRLHADYTRDTFSGQVSLRLNGTGQRLDGDWFTYSGSSGLYTSFRKLGASCANPAMSSGGTHPILESIFTNYT